MPMMLCAVFLIGFSTLAFEVLLARIFSITQWNHLSFMVISIALFGFAASGTFLSIFNARRMNRQARSITIEFATTAWLVLYSLTTLLAFVAVNQLPLDYFRLPVQPVQSIYVLAAFILLALPFFFSGGMVVFAYVRMPQHTGLIYFATMAGSACGAVAPALLLPVFSEGQLVVFFALLPLMGAAVSFLSRPPNTTVKKRRVTHQIAGVGLGVLIICGGFFLWSPYGHRLISVKPSAYKTLSQVLQYPQTRIDQTINSIRGRTDRVSSPHIRFAPGLSLKYKDSLAPQTAAFRDGDHQLVLYPPAANDSIQFAPYTLSYGGYALHPNAQKALVILQNGGTAVASVLAAGIADVTLVMDHPAFADIIGTHYRQPVIAQPARAYLSAIDKQFDIIQIENWGTSIPGSAALNQDHLYTSDAFAQYLQHLTPEGLIIVSRRLLLPPADSLRLWAAAYEGLKKMDAQDPAHHLAVIRNWDTFALFISRAPLRNLDHLQRFAQERNFDIVFAPGMTAAQVNRFNQFKAPYHFNEIKQLADAYRREKENNYFRSYLLDVRPQSDNRPFPDRYLKWRKVKTLYLTLGSRLYALLLSGEIVVMVVFTEALLISVLLLFLPLVFIRRDLPRPTWTQVLYFFGVGPGFMFVELFFIKKYILLFGDPIISFSVVVAGVLIFSSLGGAWSQRQRKAVLKPALWVLVGLLIVAFMVLNPLVHFLMARPPVWQYLGALVVLGPIGFLMGLPFTIGMRDMLSSASQRAYAWSANGCASVLASIVAAQMALMYGITFILGSAVVAYGIVLLSWQHLSKT